MPLTGLSRALLASLPQETKDDIYCLDEFTFEIELNLTGEYGSLRLFNDLVEQ